MSQYLPYDVVIATFNPKRLDTLRPEAAKYIGRRGEFRVLWPITSEDSSVFAGQEAWEAMESFIGKSRNEMNNEDYFGWVPTEDLTDIKVISLSWYHTETMAAENLS